MENLVYDTPNGFVVKIEKKGLSKEIRNVNKEKKNRNLMETVLNILKHGGTYAF